MSCLRCFALPLIGGILVAASPCTSQAALIVTTGPFSIFPSDAEAEIVVAPVDFTGPFDETAPTSMEQSFRVPSDMLLRRIYFRSTIAGAGGKTVNLTIYRVSNSLASTTLPAPDEGDILLADQFTVPAVTSESGSIVQINLSPALALPANVGSAGYVMRLSGNSTFPWVRTGTTVGSTYTFGTGYEDSAAKTPFPPGRDYVVAFSSLPEPTSLALVAFAAGLIASVRRR